MGSTACGEPSPTACLIERGTRIPRNAQRERRLIAGGVGLDAETLHSIFFQNCLRFIGIAIHFITENRFKHVSACATQSSVGLHGAPIKLNKRWGSLCIQKIALDRWKTCAVSGRRLPGENWNTGWRKQRNGENSRNLPTPSSREYPSSSIGARNPAITEFKRRGTLPLTG
jgi:hypothetical protein